MRNKVKNQIKLPLTILVFYFVSFFFVPISIYALEPPRAGEIERLRRDGLLQRNLLYAREIANNRFNPFLMRDALLKTKRNILRNQGFSESEVIRRTPSFVLPPAPVGTIMPSSGDVRILTLLIDFSNTENVFTRSAINEVLFGQGNPNYQPAGGLRQFYRTSSYNQLNITGNTLEWYRSNARRPVGPIDDARQRVVRDSIIRVVLNYHNQQGHDFSQYDSNGDGVVDHFIVLWAGPPGDWASFWWGYHTNFSIPSFQLDGVRFGNYSWLWEHDIAQDGPVNRGYNPRTVIHETGHALGLPDYYDYDDSEGPDGGIGCHDMMHGNHGDHNCFSKYLLDWIDPTLVNSGSVNLSLRPSGTSRDAVIIWPFAEEDITFGEFFMVQNRQRVGLDNNSGMPGDGMLIWHIDATLNTSQSDFRYDNQYTNHKLISLMEADGLNEIETNSDCFDSNDYYRSGRSFTRTSNPSSLNYNGRDTRIRITNISNPGNTMSANFEIQNSFNVNTSLSDMCYNQGWRTDRHPRMLGDVSGDGRADIVGFGQTGVYVALGRPNGTFTTSQLTISDLCYQQGWQIDRHPRMLGDVNGDGRADIVGFGQAGVYVALGASNGTFAAPQLTISDLCYQQDWRINRHLRMLGDVNGDGRADIVGFGQAGVYVALGRSNGTFAAPQLTISDLCYQQGWRIDRHPRMLGDVNGDERADIIGFGQAGVYVALGRSNGTFAAPQLTVSDLCYQQGWLPDRHPRMLGDIDVDGRVDIVGFGQTGVYVARGRIDGTFTSPQLALENLCYEQGWRTDRHPRMIGDLNNDGRIDIIGFGQTGVYVARGRSNGTFYPPQLAFNDLCYAQGWQIDRNPRLIGDVNWDRRIDIVGFGTSNIFLAFWNLDI